MSDTPWTPGPWSIEKNEGANEEFYGDPIWAGPAIVFDSELHGRESEHAEADARLIAAAPEMADLLTRLATAPSWTDRHEANALMARIRGEA